MGVKHTPGPWKIGRTDFDNTGEVIEINASDGTTVAHILSQDQITDHEKADARLIVAAPELLKALRWSVDHEGECIGDHAKILKAAKALLAKIKGA